MKIDDYKAILRKYWGYDSFRGVQQEIIESIDSGRDTLGLMPTGGGKSVTFQVPAIAKKGVCLVITPLIALMKDQVSNLRRRGIRAAAIYSGMTHSDIVTVLENAIFGAVRILYVSPERLASPIFQTKVKHMEVSLITVDEAHCISQWGYDFRPSYLKIADLRTLLPNVPVLALTATATPSVVDDIQERLGFERKNVFRMSFERKNLAYVVRKAEDKQGELVHILGSVEGSAIVYARSRQRTKDISDMLNERGMSATFYNAGLENALKDQRQKSWQEGKTRIMVATNAFGMGIDKSDVRLVVHIDCPDSVEAYFQEAGRAGRDGKKAYAVLLYSPADHQKLAKRVTDNFPPKDYIKDVYDHLAYFYQIAVGSGYDKTFEFNIDRFSYTYKYFPLQVNSALRILDRAGYIEYTEEQDNAARVMFTVGRDDLYALKGNSDDEDRVVIALLRNYGGLFCDYAFIDESLIAQQSGMARDAVYHALKSLNSKRIVSFIPKKSTPTIRYKQRREDAKDLLFSREVYEDRKNDFIQRTKAMLHYAQSNDKCRSRLLLNYFGEDNAHDCHQCDVCLSERGKMPPMENRDEAEAMIMRLLADGERHHVTELKALRLPTAAIDAAISHLMEEERLHQENGLLMAAK